MGSFRDTVDEEPSLRETTTDTTKRDEAPSHRWSPSVLTTTSTRSPTATPSGGGPIGKNEPGVAATRLPSNPKPHTARTVGAGQEVRPMFARPTTVARCPPAPWRFVTSPRQLHARTDWFVGAASVVVELRATSDPDNSWLDDSHATRTPKSNGPSHRPSCTWTRLRAPAPDSRSPNPPWWAIGAHGFRARRTHKRPAHNHRFDEPQTCERPRANAGRLRGTAPSGLGPAPDRSLFVSRAWFSGSRGALRWPVSRA